jgi:GNAT superfamily N-acetyltransferase
VDVTLRVLDDEHLPPELLEQAHGLCRAAFGAGFTDVDWAHARGGQRVVGVRGVSVVGHAAVVPRDLRVGGAHVQAGYVEAVAVLPTLQGGGIGTSVMHAVAGVLGDRYAAGFLSTGRPGFYERLGWTRWRGRTFVDEGGGALRRTADEDDGILVLEQRAVLDVAADLVCTARDGDDW